MVYLERQVTVINYFFCFKFRIIEIFKLVLITVKIFSYAFNIIVCLTGKTKIRTVKIKMAPINLV